MQSVLLRVIGRKLGVLASATAMASLAIWCLAPAATESAGANGDTRTLHLYHTHTFETIDATFRVDGHYDPAVLKQLNHFLRDWRNDDEHEMDPRLFDAVWEAYRSAGATDRIQIYSAYRSPETNAMLRRRSRAVAEHSQHMLGKAMDTTMPGFPMYRIREAGMKLQHGGVGWYPSANFVHLDVGGVRSWPRMPYAELASLFPDGKTVHIASDGRPLPGYEQARLEIAARDGAESVPPAQESSGFFAWLFGGNGGGAAREDEEDRRAPVAVAAAAPPVRQQAPEPEQVAAQPVAAAAEPAAPPPVEASTQGRGEQVAALEPADAAPMQLDNADLPLPPRRPVDLAEAPEIPLPPIRPDALDRLQTASIRFTDAQAPADADAIGGLVTATRTGLPAMRRSGLPALITQGADVPVPPSRALAFAAAEADDDASAPMPIARPANLAKPMALRGARHRTIVAAAAPSDATADALDATPSAALAGPRLTGLRSAARLMAMKASL